MVELKINLKLFVVFSVVEGDINSKLPQYEVYIYISCIMH